MRKYLILFLTALVSQVVLAQQEGYRTNELLIQLSDNSMAGRLMTDLKQAGGLATGIQIEDCLSPEFQMWQISFDQRVISAVQMKERVRQLPYVTAVQFNHFVKERILEPNDPSYSADALWAFKNIGQTVATMAGTVDADIDAPEAWEVATGGLTASLDTIVVAVIDGGFDINHGDLNVWRNFNEIKGNGIDDDGNGYIDDFNGWNAISNSAAVSSSNHGTRCAGIIGAKGNNASGVVGVNWNVKVMNLTGSTSDEAKALISYGYIYKMRKLYDQTAGAKGAFIVATSASFGVDYGNPADFPLWCAVFDTLGKVGVLNVGATANQNVNVDTDGDIPTACSSSYLVSVTNSNNRDLKETFAGYGKATIDLAAPGTSIVSTINGGGVGSGQTGTSYSTPMVAGAVALMYAAADNDFMTAYKADPPKYSLILKQVLLNATDQLAVLKPITLSGGRLNLFGAVKGIQGPVITALLPADNSTGVAKTSNLTVTFNQNIAKGTGNIYIRQGASVAEIIDVNASNASVSGNQLILDPDFDLPDGPVYITIDRGAVVSAATSKASIGLQTDTDWNFTVLDNPPVKTALSPADNAGGVLLNSPLIITFNETITAGTGNITITQNGTLFQTIPAAGPLVSISGSVVTISHNTFSANAAIDVEIANNAFYDLSSNAFAGVVPADWNFSTELTGVADHQEPFATVYPNPFDDKIVLDGFNGTWSYSLTDISGKVVAAEKDISTGVQVLDTRQLARGVYYLQVKSDSGVTGHKLIK